MVSDVGVALSISVVGVMALVTSPVGVGPLLISAVGVCLWESEPRPVGVGPLLTSDVGINPCLISAVVLLCRTVLPIAVNPLVSYTGGILDVS